MTGLDRIRTFLTRGCGSRSETKKMSTIGLELGWFHLPLSSSIVELFYLMNKCSNICHLPLPNPLPLPLPLALPLPLPLPPLILSASITNPPIPHSAEASKST